MSQFNIATSDYLITGTNCSVTQFTVRDNSDTFTGGTTGVMGMMKGKNVMLRIQITPSVMVKSIDLDISHQNQIHGTTEYVTFYAKASTSADAWPTKGETSSIVIGGLGSGKSNPHTPFSIPLASATRSAFYVYVWAVLTSLYSESVGQHTQYCRQVFSANAVKGGVAVRVKTGASTWSQASAVYVKINSTTWKEVSALNAKTADGWKEAT